MTSLLASSIARRGVSLVVTSAPRALAARRTGVTFFSTERVPAEDYQNGHLITDHLEYLDDMIGKTLEIEGNMEKLKQTYAEKRQKYQDDSVSLEEMERLFQQAEQQKHLITQQVAVLRKSLSDRKSAFAVDAPDGTSDELERLYADEADDIINESAKRAAQK